MIKILHLRAPSDLHRGQVEIKYCLPCTVFLRRRGRMWEEKAPALHGSSGRWMWPGSERRERGSLHPWAAAAGPSLHRAPLYDSSVFILGAKPFTSDIAQGGEIIRCLFFLSPFPAVGLFFLGSYIVLSFSEPNMVRVTSAHYCVIFPLSLEWGAIVSS